MQKNKQTQSNLPCPWRKQSSSSSWTLIEKSSPRKSYNCGWTANFGSEFILWSWSSNLLRWSIHFVATLKMSIFEISTEWAKGSTFFKSMNAWFTPWILRRSRSFAARRCRLTPVSMRFLRLFSLRLPCWAMGLLTFSKSPSPLIEEGVGEFSSGQEKGSTVSSSQVHEAWGFPWDMFGEVRGAFLVWSLWIMTSSKCLQLMV